MHALKLQVALATGSSSRGGKGRCIICPSSFRTTCGGFVSGLSQAQQAPRGALPVGGAGPQEARQSHARETRVHGEGGELASRQVPLADQRGAVSGDGDRGGLRIASS